MSIHVALSHRSHYAYDRPVNLGPQIVRLRPAPHSRTRVLSYSLKITPGEHFLNWQQDPQSNYLARLVFNGTTREFTVDVGLVVEMSVYNPFDFFLEPGAEQFPFAYDSGLDHELEPFRRCGPLSPKFSATLKKILNDFPPPTPAGTKPAEKPRTIDFLVHVNQLLCQEIKYLIRLEPGVQSPEETLEKGSGSCRDSAWLLCQLLRHAGLASRFVSGYLIQLAPDVKSLDGPSGPEKDFTDLHAWCEVYLPGAGWIGFDPTSGLMAGEGHIPLAATPDPQSAAPISGAVDECECEFSVEMSVSRIHESPRVTNPYSDAQWDAILNLGHRVDEDLIRQDCRLTMGGEPTFVSIDDMDGAEWNTEAMGPTKRRLADTLLGRLKDRFAHDPLLHYGQGKWYPGEPLPRWALACYWRKDGQPIWTRQELFANEQSIYGFDTGRAEQFIHALADRLGCGDDHIIPAYEDAWYYLWKERRLPANVDPLKSNLRNEDERAQLARVFERGLDKVAGYVLPLQSTSTPAMNSWESGPWFFRTERCYLIPGDSPVGLRLPLDSLPWATASDANIPFPEDPTQERPPLVVRRSSQSQPVLHRPVAPPGNRLISGNAEITRVDQQPQPNPARGVSLPGVVRTALCVETRNGRVHVFMPPIHSLETYLNLAAAVEETAGRLDTPVVLEGYPPPSDSRLNVIKVTPDPGVIEVNMHPAATWKEMVRNTEVLYDEARQARLCAEKFMVDGRHTGTGGGNHIVLGGSTPVDSPLLRRPDLLRSLITHWQNHPSLSFLFSGMFIGPTSQSPRVDESRNDSLHELELAFRQIPDHAALPWLADRLFRNLLIDSTGNTHRAEFCIDKLYSPDSASGRLGLLEMRGFEMPPHPRMSLAQQLLLRTLIAKFWQAPCRNRLVRWGTDIHDRWMLPHFVWNDFRDVIEDLRQSGYPIRADWFAPHFEFRFPQIGDLEVRDVQLEIRQALEPWHVLGEEGGGGGTVRYVDSSLERLQVKARGLIDSRHVISVGGISLPLHPTGTNGEYVAGVRYRAWQPSQCLHPTIGVHTPLVFNVVDSWNQRSLGGCTFHVAHPGGRNHTSLPVNAYEAESRRLARFFRHGHTIGRMIPKTVERNPEFPFTLDLRTT